MTAKTEYYIKEIKPVPNAPHAGRFGVYYGDGILGYYNTYQQAKRDMVRMRDQQFVANDWRDIQYSVTVPATSYSTINFNAATWVWDSSPVISANATSVTITDGTNLARPLSDEEIRELEGLMVTVNDSGR